MNININEVEVLDIHEYDNKNKNNSGKIKILLLLLIMILIVLIGLGLYSFLKYAKEQTKGIKIEDKVVELGSSIDKKTLSIKNKNKECDVDLSKVDTNRVGTYKYYVKCGKKEYSANIEVKDTTAPEVETKMLNIKTNTNITPKEFIKSIKDLSQISYEFGDDFDVNNYNVENGLYLVPIKVLDEYNNKKEVPAILLVSNLVANKFLTATKISTTDYDATLQVTDKIGFNQANYYVNAVRIYDYTFNSETEYNKVKEEYDTKKSIRGVEGKIICDSDNMNIKLISLLTREELNQMNGVFPFTYIEIEQLYKSLDYKTESE